MVRERAKFQVVGLRFEGSVEEKKRDSEHGNAQSKGKRVCGVGVTAHPKQGEGASSRSAGGRCNENARDGCKEFGVFVRIADGNAYGFRKTHPGERANNDTFAEEIVGEGFGVEADLDEEEVGFAGDGIETEAVEFIVETLAFAAIHFGGTLDVFAIVEGGQSSSLPDTGDVEGSAELVHFGDECGMANAIADAESGETVDFGESAQGENVVVLLEMFEGVGEIAAFGVLLIGFIENNQNIARDLFKEGGELGIAEGGASRIIGIGNVNDACPRSDGASNGIEIECEIAHGRLDEFATAGTNGDGEESEGALAGDAFKAGTKQNAGSEINDFAGAKADKDFLGADSEARGENFTEALAAAVGIPVGFTEGAARGVHRLRGRTQRIFVGGQLDGVDLEVLLDFLDGFPGYVRGKTLDVIRDEFFESMSHGRLRFEAKLMERIPISLLCTIGAKSEVPAPQSVLGWKGCAVLYRRA
jgi:hypothetical protein